MNAPISISIPGLSEALSSLHAEVAALRREVAAVQMTPMPEWLSLPEFAAHVGRSPKTVRAWIAKGEVETKRVGSVVMVKAR